MEIGYYVLVFFHVNIIFQKMTTQYIYIQTMNTFMANILVIRMFLEANSFTNVQSKYFRIKCLKLGKIRVYIPLRYYVSMKNNTLNNEFCQQLTFKLSVITCILSISSYLNSLLTKGKTSSTTP